MVQDDTHNSEAYPIFVDYLQFTEGGREGGLAKHVNKYEPTDFIPFNHLLYLFNYFLMTCCLVS